MATFTNPQPGSVAALLPKLHDADSDLRYMALNDLFQIFKNAHPNFLTQDFNLSAKTVDGIISTLKDTNGEVQNQAVKCLGPFVNKCPEAVLSPLIDKVSTMQTDNTLDNSIPALALREIVVSLPRPVPGVARRKAVLDAYSAISKALLPRLVGYNIIPPAQKVPPPPMGMLDNDINKGTDSNAIDVLSEVARCYGSMLQQNEIEALVSITLNIIEAERANSVLKKKAVAAVAMLATHFSDPMLDAFISKLIEHLGNPHLTSVKRRLYITMLGSLARSIPKKFGPRLQILTQFVVTALSDVDGDEAMASDDEDNRSPEVDDVREAALTALESFLLSCPQHMRAFTDEVITSATNFIRYDPNLANYDDDDEEDDDAFDEDADDFGDEDFEAEGGFGDEDDSSWKVRRCAAKVLHALILTRSDDLLQNGTLYGTVAPTLIGRFKEREESVRLEIIAGLTALVQNTRSDAFIAVSAVSVDGSQGTMGPPARKRRRGGSDVSMYDTQSAASGSAGYTVPVSVLPPTGPLLSLSKSSPDILRGVTTLLKSGPMSSKQASLALIKSITIAQQGGLEDHLDLFMDSLVDIIRNPMANGTHGSSSSTVTTNSVRTEALQLLAVVANFSSPQSFQPYTGKAIPVVVSVSGDRYSKVAVEALNSLEQIVSALTPPRAAGQSQEHISQLVQVHEALTERIQSKETDTEVRRRAIHVLGLLLGRTSSTSLLPTAKRSAALEIIFLRLKHELTRLASVRAVNIIAKSASSEDDLSPDASWVRNVSLELSAQFRKASRSLRGASLEALQAICTSPASQQRLDDVTIKEITASLLPLLETDHDLHLLSMALDILTIFVKMPNGGQNLVTAAWHGPICEVLKKQLPNRTTEVYLTLISTIGEKGAGSVTKLMDDLMKVAGDPNANSDLSGRAIGTLLIAGGENNFVHKSQAFATELQNSKQPEKSRIIAVTILGECARITRVEPEQRYRQFKDGFAYEGSSLPLACAIAMGRAGSSNVAIFSNKIVKDLGAGGPGADSNDRYLMHAVKEILQHEAAQAEVRPFAQALWTKILTASRPTDNKAIGAECLGRLAITQPKSYLPQLHDMLSDKEVNARGMVISALRFTLADTDAAYDEYLRPILVPMLITMLSDSDLDNRRLALMTFNSAMSNKTDLILPQLGELLPLTMRETVLRPELIREVQMGPFKHKVDDGLEIRKSAYETLYSLLESAFNRLNVSDLFDRVIAGVLDDHDIRILCNIMITKLIVIAPDETINHLQAIAEKFRAVLIIKPKDNAVKQEIEKITDSQRGVLKASIQLNKALPADTSSDNPQLRAWAEYWEGVKKEQANLLKLAEEDLREKER